MSATFPPSTTSERQGEARRVQNILGGLRLVLIILVVAIGSLFFVIVPVGERGILLQLGAVQPQVLAEGVHIIIPGIQSVVTLNVRLQSHIQKSEAATSDLQDVGIDLAVAWHFPADAVPLIYQRLGDNKMIIKTVLEPALEDSIKSVVATLTAEQLITQRDSLRQQLEEVLTERLSAFDLVLDGIDIVQLDFSPRFRAAVEAKQVAEQDARRAAYEAIMAQRQALARVYRAEGEAKAQGLLQATLTPEVLQHQAIERWNGRLPMIMDSEVIPFIDWKTLKREDKNRRRS